MPSGETRLAFERELLPEYFDGRAVQAVKPRAIDHLRRSAATKPAWTAGPRRLAAQSLVAPFWDFPKTPGVSRRWPEHTLFGVLWAPRPADDSIRKPRCNLTATARLAMSG